MFGLTEPCSLASPPRDEALDRTRRLLRSEGGWIINSDRWINEAAATQAAEQALHGQKLLDEQAVQAARDGHPGQPVLVERRDDEDRDYYLVPWNTERGTELIVRIGAASGEFLGVVHVADPTASHFLNADEALARAREELPGVEFDAPRCVWFPCRQSTTPMRPFYEFQFDGGTLYVDLEGIVYRELTPLGLGG